ncbi:MAG: energy transducer TonB [Prolixibacteraceae bacterium]|nr:energy transducer TonB [Prolixibacteraceae bacterium]
MIVEEDTTSEAFFVVEQMPEFPGGQLALRKYLANSIKYPVIAQENGIQGKVFINFVVDKDGGISNVKVFRGVDASLDKEAMRVVRAMPKWIPGRQGGQPVRVSYTVPINFVLE